MLRISGTVMIYVSVIKMKFLCNGPPEFVLSAQDFKEKIVNQGGSLYISIAYHFEI